MEKAPSKNRPKAKGVINLEDILIRSDLHYTINIVKHPIRSSEVLLLAKVRIRNPTEFSCLEHVCENMRKLASVQMCLVSCRWYVYVWKGA